MWIGRILLELGRLEEAVRHFRTVRYNPVADLWLGVAYERAGWAVPAAEAYDSILEHWARPDPELMPLVERARAGLDRLSRR